MRAFYDARRAGVSADRIAQGMSPDNARGEEGPVESRLYTDLSEAAPARERPRGRGLHAGAGRRRGCALHPVRAARSA